MEYGLRHKCNSNNDCEDGMVCQYENSNRTIGVAKFMSSKTKLCLCDNDNGYVEDILHDICSGANLQGLVSFLVSICSLLAPFLVSAHMRKHF
ncbi:GD15183 [Drosophila simulans]|uniref:GD15183 n=1 Tax=Drosophila simulans TaxID=7240 RepID=B4NTG0_DROSI|nr:GD15183 [Drosophila simulans]